MPSKRKTSKEKPPVWSMYDNNNAESAFAFIYQDLICTQSFINLSNAEKAFLIVCMVHCQDDSNRSRTAAYKRKENKELGLDENADVGLWTDRRQGYFVFPADQLKEYGYSRSNGSKLLQQLVEKGFIERIRKNKYRVGMCNDDSNKLNVYKMSSKWKSKEPKES